MKANRQGRVGKGVANLFSGLLRNARDGSTYHIKGRSKNARILINSSSTTRTCREDKASAVTFPYKVFEYWMLFHLSKAPPNEQVKELIDALRTAGDEEAARLRLRAALRKTLDVVYLLVVPLCADRQYRLCAAQVWFEGAKCQSYLFAHKRVRFGDDSDSWGMAFRSTADLRRQEVVVELEEAMKLFNATEFERGHWPFPTRWKYVDSYRLCRYLSLFTGVPILPGLEHLR
jgi:hypothetical protein